MKQESDIIEKFFHLLQIAVGKSFGGTIEVLEEEWGAIYDLASKQSLVSVILQGVDKVGNNDHSIPRENVLRWIGESEQIRQRNNRVNQQCEQLTSWFKGKGFSSCVLKGQGAAQLYLEPDTRQPGDIDIWVDGDRDDVVRKMRDQYIGVTYVDYVNCHASFFTDTDVEVHFRPSYFFNPFANRRLQKWIQENKSVQMANFDDEAGFCYPTIAFNLVFSLIHIYRHVFSEGIGLRQLMDYYYILTHSSNEERVNAYATLCSFGMQRFVVAVMYVLRIVFDMDETLLLCEPNKDEGEFLLSEIMRGGNFGKFDDRNIYVPENEKIKRGLNNFKRNLRFLRQYPSEVFWMPLWKTWHWGWRKWKGYL